MAEYKDMQNKKTLKNLLDSVTGTYISVAWKNC